MKQRENSFSSAPVCAQTAHSLYPDADDMLLELITRAALNL